MRLKWRVTNREALNSYTEIIWTWKCHLIVLAGHLVLLPYAKFTMHGNISIVLIAVWCWWHPDVCFIGVLFYQQRFLIHGMPNVLSCLHSIWWSHREASILSSAWPLNLIIFSPSKQARGLVCFFLNKFSSWTPSGKRVSQFEFCISHAGILICCLTV